MFIPLERDYDVVYIKVGYANFGEFQFPRGNGKLGTGIRVSFKQPIELFDGDRTETVKSPCGGTLALVSNKRRGQSLEIH